jgi:hypothetical protein
MGTVTVSLPADGSTGTVSQYNTPLTTVVNELNGNIDNANIKSAAAIATSKLADDAGITNAKIANSTITASKLNLSPQSAQVDTSETTTSTTFVDLTTVTDTVTVTIGANGLALLFLNCRLLNSGTNASLVSFVASGANTITAADNIAIINGGGQDHTEMYHKLLTGLTVGSTTFKMKYRVSAGTGTFINRRITVIPL